MFRSGHPPPTAIAAKAAVAAPPGKSLRPPMLNRPPRKDPPHKPAKTRPRRAGRHDTRMGREIDETGEYARREIHAGERQPSGETLEHRAKLDQDGDVDEEMKRPDVHERRRHQTPPLAVRRPRPEAR